MIHPPRNLPPGVSAGTFDQLEAMLRTEQPDHVWMELGERGHFGAATVVHASQAVHEAITRLHAGQSLILSIGGYDRDPRELWTIPEARQFVRRVMVHAGIRHWSHPAVALFNESTLALLLQCGVFGSDHPYAVELVPEKTVELERYKPEES